MTYLLQQPRLCLLGFKPFKGIGFGLVFYFLRKIILNTKWVFDGKFAKSILWVRNVYKTRKFAVHDKQASKFLVIAVIFFEQLFRLFSNQTPLHEFF